jgi:toxin ParE1/3/4
MKCSLHGEAFNEYREAALYYGDRARGLGEAFTTEVEAAIIFIQTSPQTRAASKRGVRRYLLRRFPYVIHYVVEQSVSGGEELVVIYAVRHSRRNPNYWLHRLPPRTPNS